MVLKEGGGSRLRGGWCWVGVLARLTFWVWCGEVLVFSFVGAWRLHSGIPPGYLLHLYIYAYLRTQTLITWSKRPSCTCVVAMKCAVYIPAASLSSCRRVCLSVLVPLETPKSEKIPPTATLRLH